MNYICGPRLYEYENWFFEFHKSCGPWPLKKDGEPRKKAGKKFWEMINKFQKEPDIERFRVGGGCQRF